MIDEANYIVIIDYSKGVGREIQYIEDVKENGIDDVYGLKEFIEKFGREMEETENQL